MLADLGNRGCAASIACRTAKSNLRRRPEADFGIVWNQGPLSRHYHPSIVGSHRAFGPLARFEYANKLLSDWRCSLPSARIACSAWRHSFRRLKCAASEPATGILLHAEFSSIPNRASR
jgi:hypothetical protein